MIGVKGPVSSDGVVMNLDFDVIALNHLIHENFTTVNVGSGLGSFTTVATYFE